VWSNRWIDCDLRFISNRKRGFTGWQYHYDNTTQKYKYHIHTNIHITQNIITKIKPNKKESKENQISSQTYTNSKGHITTNE
jgi:hypothetical protein